VPLADQVGALKDLQDAGKIRHLGLCVVTVPQIEEVRRITKIVSVQNRYHLKDRASDDVVDYCEREGLTFIPFLPIGKGAHAVTEGPLAEIAKEVGATPPQVALAWLLHRSPVILPIPGTSSLAHLEENVRAAELELSDQQFKDLSELS
jgi:aryl-alcohol dehydrogenase-like predicted oxidoreductase